MHGEILELIDGHLAELQALRDGLDGARAVDPGERLQVAAAAAASAQRCAQGLTQVLAGEAPSMHRMLTH